VRSGRFTDKDGRWGNLGFLQELDKNAVTERRPHLAFSNEITVDLISS